MENKPLESAELDIRTVAGGPLGVNTYVVGLEGESGCIVIDPGAEVSRVFEAVNGRTVDAVLLTHAHFDHMLYAEHWLHQGAKLYVHRLDAPALSDPKLNLCAMIHNSLALPSPDIELIEGDIVHEAGLSLQVLHTPGHTPGSVCFLLGKALFSGDTLFYQSYGRVDLPGGSMQKMACSLARLSELDGETIAYPGHGMKTKIAWERGMQL